LPSWRYRSTAARRRASVRPSAWHGGRPTDGTFTSSRCCRARKRGARPPFRWRRGRHFRCCRRAESTWPPTPWPFVARRSSTSLPTIQRTRDPWHRGYRQGPSPSPGPFPTGICSRCAFLRRPRPAVWGCLPPVALCISLEMNRLHPHLQIIVPSCAIQRRTLRTDASVRGAQDVRAESSSKAVCEPDRRPWRRLTGATARCRCDRHRGELQ